MERFALHRSSSGFTLIELMITVTVLGILAAIAIPRMNEMIHATQESTTKGNLGALRSALSIYYADTSGWYPADGTSPKKRKKKPCFTCTASLEALEDSGYIAEIPAAVIPRAVSSPGHTEDDNSDVITFGALNQVIVTDQGGWAYQWNPTLPNWGLLLVNCNHRDRRGAAWTSY